MSIRERLRRPETLLGILAVIILAVIVWRVVGSYLLAPKPGQLGARLVPVRLKHTVLTREHNPFGKKHSSVTEEEDPEGSIFVIDYGPVQHEKLHFPSPIQELLKRDSGNLYETDTARVFHSWQQDQLAYAPTIVGTFRSWDGLYYEWKIEITPAILRPGTKTVDYSVFILVSGRRTYEIKVSATHDYTGDDGNGTTEVEWYGPLRVHERQ